MEELLQSDAVACALILPPLQGDDTLACQQQHRDRQHRNRQTQSVSSGIILHLEGQMQLQQQEAGLHSARACPEVECKAMPLLEEELVEEALHQRVEEHLLGLHSRINGRDEFHDIVCRLAGRIDFIQLKHVLRDRPPAPDYLAAAAHSMLEHAMISQLCSQLERC
eukprot:920523-Prymnesium_polylepis.1